MGDDEHEKMMAMMKGKAGGQRASVSAEAYGAWNQKKEFTAPVHPKEPEHEDAIRKVLKLSFLFSTLPTEALEQVVGAVQKFECKAGDVVINQGDDGDFLFVIETGTLECFKKSGGDQFADMVKTCNAGEAFGELALLYNCPRAASVRAKTDSLCWKLDRETFANLVQGAAQKRMERMTQFIAKCPLLQNLAMYERTKLCEALKVVEFAEGTTIIDQGDVGDDIFFIESGKVVAKKQFVPGVFTDVMVHETGDYFGELALLRNEPRAARVDAAMDTICMATDRSTFKGLLGSIKEIITRQATRYDVAHHG